MRKGDKIYVAGASAAQKSAANLAYQIALWGYETLHAWTSIDQANPPHEQAIWADCLHQVRKANALVVDVPDATLRGAIFEAGYACALRLPVIVFDPGLRQAGDWHHAPNCHWVNSLAELEYRLSEVF